jgi:DNA (cytosine-5)-methyltransferase 1
MAKAYYNENDRKACAWLRELIKAGLITAGDVDERSIADVQPEDLKGYARCHFFAGIGGWDYALQLAGWPEGEPVWSGSCPCQPFSVAGKGLGTKDKRHLWPEFFRLIAECRPPVCFGEQVASKAGREWLAGVRADLEGVAYAVGAADLCAAGVGAPHIRQRLYWMAYANSQQANPTNERGLHSKSGAVGWMGDAEPSRSQGVIRHIAKSPAENLGTGCWSDYDVIPCRDGKLRRVERGTFPLAPRYAGRVGLLRGYGNAIVPQVAAEFVKAYMESIPQAG